MDQVGRRAFLRNLAKGVAYTAPVVYSMAAPVDLVGQGMSSVKGGVEEIDKVTGDGQTQFGPPPRGSVPPGG